jgi:broad specificity phosphatase PhoE
MTVLEQIKLLAAQLTADEKESLARLLESNQQPTQQPSASVHAGLPGEEMRERRLQWLKSHREEYAGQYVALSGDVLVGHGPTIRIASEAAQTHGVANPFLIRITLEKDPLFAGW